MALESLEIHLQKWPNFSCPLASISKNDVHDKKNYRQASYIQVWKQKGPLTAEVCLSAVLQAVTSPKVSLSGWSSSMLTAMYLVFPGVKNSCLCKLDPFDVEVAPFAEHILSSGGIMLEACRNLMLAGVFHGFLKKMDWGISKPRLGLSQGLFKKGWHDILESSIEPRFRISGSSKPSCFCNPHPLIAGHCHHMTDSICKLRAGRGQKSSLLTVFVDHYIQLWACRVMSCKKNCS